MFLVASVSLADPVAYQMTGPSFRRGVLEKDGVWSKSKSKSKVKGRTSNHSVTLVPTQV